MCLVAAASVLPRTSHAAEKLPTILVRATKHAYDNCIVTIALPLTEEQKAAMQTQEWHLQEVDVAEEPPQSRTPDTVKKLLSLPDTTAHNSALPSQISEQDGKTLLTFVIDHLPPQTVRAYHLVKTDFVRSRWAGLSVIAKNEDMEVYTQPGSHLFTRYATHSGPNKPFFYPILTPDGQPMTRTWPLDPASTESHDHPHHRGLWFTHSDLNGIDFWTEQNTDKIHVGKTVARGFTNPVSGNIFGGFRAYTEWRAPDDKLIATDVRDVRVYQLGTDRVMDFEITVKPEGGPLKWGDNKDGTFGLRLPDTLAPAPEKSAHIATPTGHIETSSGLKDGAAWGQPAEWVDYYGPIGGKAWGVAMFDNPQNLRHPTTWHARDYALFSANPFGLHDFKRGDKGVGDYLQPADKTLTFRYRLLFHAGDTTAAHVAEQYANYADPPEVTVQ